MLLAHGQIEDEIGLLNSTMRGFDKDLPLGDLYGEVWVHD
jgi:hypothetical protein